MKIGITYNVFEDSIELLPYSLQCVRPYVDYINVVYQHMSNAGKGAETDYHLELERLRSQGLIDEMILYIPPTLGGHFNEANKRNIGREKCVAAGCSYVMTMDSDELYEGPQFQSMIKTVVEGDFDASACQMLTYYKSSKYIVDPPEDYFVPLLCKADRTCGFANFPVLVDPTRSVPCEKVRIFTRNEIQMHHMSWVRKDIRKKIINSSAYPNFAHMVDNIINHYHNFDGRTGLLGAVQMNLIELEQPLFNVEI